MKEKMLQGYQGNTLKSQLGSLYETFKGESPDEDLIFNLSGLQWAGPFLILPLSAYIDTTKSEPQISGFSEVYEYLEGVSFPLGVHSTVELEQQIKASGNCIPISVLHKEDIPARERLENTFEEIAYRMIGAVKGAENAFFYPLAELVTNIFDHSLHDRGYIFAQFYPKDEFLDICIVDRGRGLVRAYFEEKNQKLSDAEAIKEAMLGNSTKVGIERGYGLRTSKDVVCRALDGEFVLISGSQALFSNGGEDTLISMPGFRWRGVIVGYRIPVPTREIDISGYIE